MFELLILLLLGLTLLALVLVEGVGLGVTFVLVRLLFELVRLALGTLDAGLSLGFAVGREEVEGLLEPEPEGL